MLVKFKAVKSNYGLGGELKLFRKLKQKLCRHNNYDARWGLCLDCGWSNPEWSAIEMMKADNPFLFDKNYREAFLHKIALDGKMTVMKMAIEKGIPITDEMVEAFK